MKKILLKSIFILAVVAGLTSGCENSDSYNVPNIDCVEPGLAPTKTIEEIIAMFPTSTPILYTEDDEIEAYVTSSDEKGNIYKTISFQTKVEEGMNPVGFSVPINLTSTFAKNFIPGQKVYIKLKDLYVAKVDGAIQIGSLYQSSPSAAVEIGRISETEYQKFLFPSCVNVGESALVRQLPISGNINEANLNTLIEFTNVQFDDSSLGRTYFDVDSGGGSTNHTITGTTGGSVIIRFSSFAPFSGKVVPQGNGSIRGVLTKYGSTYQFTVRYESDIQLNNPRVDASPPKVGNDIQFLATFNENFESYAVSSNGTLFPKYVNDAFVGSRYWDVKSFSNNKYIQMTAFGATGTIKTYLMVPVAFTPGNKFSFKSKDGFNNGNVLKVYYSTNYVAGGNVADATLVNITPSFAIASGTATGYAVNFLNSGDFTIPSSLTGNGFFIFEYSGNGASGALTTTIQIDDVKVTN